MDDTTLKSIEDQAEAYHIGMLEYIRGMSQEVHDAIAPFEPIVTMQELYDADKFGYIVYRIAYGTPARSESGTAMVLCAPVSVIADNLGGVTPLQVSEKLMELAGMVVSHEIDGMTIGFPVISIVSQVIVGDETYFYLGPHGICGDLIVETAIAASALHDEAQG